MSLITLERDRDYAPCCYIICRIFKNERGEDTWDTRAEHHTRLIQTDWDWPGVARTFGWRGDDRDISGAGAYLDQIHGFGRQVEDPGYFDDDPTPDEVRAAQSMLCADYAKHLTQRIADQRRGGGK